MFWCAPEPSAWREERVQVTSPHLGAPKVVSGYPEGVEDGHEQVVVWKAIVVFLLPLW